MPSRRPRAGKKRCTAPTRAEAARSRLRLDRAAGARGEVFRRRACAARHHSVDRPQRDRRADRRQRRRKIDAHQGDDGRYAADLRPHLRSRRGGRPVRLLRPHGARPLHRNRLPGPFACRQTAAVAQLLRRPADHQPPRLYRHQAREGDRRRYSDAGDRFSRRRHQRQFHRRAAVRRRAAGDRDRARHVTTTPT